MEVYFYFGGIKTWICSYSLIVWLQIRSSALDFEPGLIFMSVKSVYLLENSGMILGNSKICKLKCSSSHMCKSLPGLCFCARKSLTQYGIQCEMKVTNIWIKCAWFLYLFYDGRLFMYLCVVISLDYTQKIWSPEKLVEMYYILKSSSGRCKTKLKKLWQSNWECIS